VEQVADNAFEHAHSTAEIIFAYRHKHGILSQVCPGSHPQSPTGQQETQTGPCSSRLEADIHSRKTRSQNATVNHAIRADSDGTDKFGPSPLRVCAIVRALCFPWKGSGQIWKGRAVFQRFPCFSAIWPPATYDRFRMRGLVCKYKEKGN
jgi:hypothetical protein